MTHKPEPRSVLSLIERVKCTSDETPPWDGIRFIRPVDSDKLAEDLKQAYPDCSTLRERKHMAAIDFLKIELHQIQTGNVATNFGKRSDHLTTPNASSYCTDTSDAHSRQDCLSTPRSQAITTQNSTSYMRQPEPEETSLSSNSFFVPSNVTPASQIVFSASDGRTLQLHTKRRMTKEEKVTYRKIRKRGACITCRRQKGKCTHIDDIPAGLECPDETVKTRKRKPSLKPDMANEHMNKNCKAVRQPGAHDTYPTPPPSSKHPPLPPVHRVIINTSGTTTTFNGFEQPTGTPEDEPWEEEIDKDGQDGQYRYVQNQLQVEPYAVPMSYEANANWHEYPIAADIQQPYSGYAQLQATEQSAPLSPVANVSPVDISYQPAFSSFLNEPWGSTKDHHLDGMESG